MPSRTQSRQRSGSSRRNEETAVVVIDAKKVVSEIEGMIERRRDQLLDLLGGDIARTDKFVTVALAAVVKPGSGLLEADPLSIVNAVRDAAQMGLEPAGPLGDGAIVAYRDSDQGGKKIAQFQPMVRGLRKLALQSPGVSVVNVGIRHVKDVFEYREGSDPFIRHEPYIDDDDPGDVMGAYAYARLNGETLVMYMNLAQIRKRQSVARTDKVWRAWPEEMMKKTVLRRLISEKIPMTARLGLALAVEEADLDRPPTVTSSEQRQLAAPGSRTRARHSAVDDVDVPEGPQGGSGSTESAKAPEDAPAVDPAVCGASGLSEGQTCVQAKRHPIPAVPHRSEDGQEWL